MDSSKIQEEATAKVEVLAYLNGLARGAGGPLFSPPYGPKVYN